MHFDLIDSVLERSNDRIVTIKLVTAAEEYLQDHFAGYPVLPGVFMLEAMVQAARRLEGVAPGQSARLCLGTVRALKYGSFVRPGQVLRVTIERVAPHDYKGRGEVLDAGVTSTDAGPATACSGRFTLRAPEPAPTETPLTDA